MRIGLGTTLFVAASLVAALSLFAAAAQAVLPVELEPLGFLLGEWMAAGGGEPGTSSGITAFTPALQDRVILRTSHAEYPASSSGPASRHDDLVIIYSAEGGGLRADYYDNEGHVIRYVVTVVSPGEAVFTSEAAAGAPAYRLTYTLAPEAVLKGRFEIAPPERPDAFSTYLSWESRQATPPAAPPGR
jgi:hypothetical protein